MKKVLVFVFAIMISSFAIGQNTIEDQVADTVCACLSAIDSSKISSNSNGLKMACLQQAMIKNKEAILKNVETEKRREEDEAKLGLKGSLMIKVQNVLVKRCPAYNLFEKKVQERRVP